MDYQYMHWVLGLLTVSTLMWDIKWLVHWDQYQYYKGLMDEYGNNPVPATIINHVRAVKKKSQNSLFIAGLCAGGAILVMNLS